MDMKALLGVRVQALRKAKNLTQAELAVLIHRSVEALAKVETGRSFPSHKTLQNLSEVLEIPLHSLFQFDEDSNGQRNRVISQLLALLNTLSDEDLEIVTAQLQTLAKSLKRKKR